MLFRYSAIPAIAKNEKIMEYCIKLTGGHLKNKLKSKRF